MKQKYLWLSVALLTSSVAREALNTFTRIHLQEPDGMDQLSHGLPSDILAAGLHAAVSGVNFILWLLLLSFAFLLLISLVGRVARRGLTL